MSERTLFIHLGPAKTGTSAFQHVLRDNIFETLHYPVTGQWKDGAHHMLILAVDGKPELNGHAVPALSEQLAALEAEISGTDKSVLISSEAISPARTLPRLLEAFESLTERYFSKTRFIYTLRNPVDRAASGYNQNVKDAFRGEARPFSSQFADFPRHYLLAPQIKTIEAFGYPVDFLMYSKAIVQELGAKVGINIGDEHVNRSINRSAGGVMMFASYLINNLFDEPEGRIRALADVRQSGLELESPVCFPHNEAALADFEATILKSDQEELASLGFSYPERQVSLGDNAITIDDEPIQALVSYFAGQDGDRGAHIDRLTVAFFGGE